MSLTEKQIEEIADELDCGMVCFYHRLTGVIQSYTDPKDPYFDPEPWQDVIDKIDSDWNNYDKFEKMNSNEGFQVMEDFALSLSDSSFKNRLLEQLSMRKPFQNFKKLIDDSEYRDDWFSFKRRAYIDFVKHQVELNKK